MAEIQCFRVVRTDQLFPGQDRVSLHNEEEKNKTNISTSDFNRWTPPSKPTICHQSVSLRRHCKPVHQSQSQNFAIFTSNIWSILQKTNIRQKFVLPVFNRNFSKLLEFFLTYFGNLLYLFLIYVWWSLDYFWKKKCRLNKRAKKSIKNFLLLPHHHPISLFEIWLYYVPKQQNVFSSSSYL